MEQQDKRPRRRRVQRTVDAPSAPMLPENPYQKKIADWLGKLKLRQVTFGGVSEKQVWKRFSELNEMYQQMLAIERARYEVLLHQAGIAFDPHTPYPEEAPQPPEQPPLPEQGGDTP
ncbi:MAG: hypothetical protein IKK57_01250 [Clostridia bacterium]|nr:hypothetical protein [Clostridia bacterium]